MNVAASPVSAHALVVDDVAAGLARECAVMDQARQLAEWVGEGRKVTASGVLRRPDVPAAAAALGVPAPAKMRTAADVPAVHRPWSVATAVGLLAVSSGSVTAAGPALPRWPQVDDATVLAGWLGGLGAACVAESDQRFPECVAILAFAALDVLDQHGALTSADLVHAVAATIRNGDQHYSWVHEMTFDRYLASVSGEAFGELLALLEAFGAVAGGEPGHDVRITPLGRWALAQVRAMVPKPIEAGISADELVARLAEFSDEDTALAAVQPWLEARPTEVAAREILAAAAGAAPPLRFAAVGVVAELGEEVAPVWQEMLGTPGLGAHARAVLAVWDRGPGLDAADQRWLAVEAAAAALAETGPDDALTCAYEGIPGEDLDAVLAALGASGHPDAEAVTRALAEFIASGAPRAIDQVLVLKVSLAHARPPIWRRVLLPAIATLDVLHEVIQVLFGWDGDHLHEFTVGRSRYSDPFFKLDDLEMGDEYDVRLAQAFSQNVRKISYLYDFGASWSHEIMLEKTRQRERGTAYPVCVAFAGDSPVEYWSEDDPQESIPFDLDEVNRELAAKARA
jgi:hypothetical protein